MSAPARLQGFLAQVLEWNPVVGLVSRKSPVAACERLLFESVELGGRLDIKPLGHVVDVGSGAGFPGLVWALLHPGTRMTLIERREKRAAFLERTSRLLGAKNVDVLAMDVGSVSRETLTPGDVDLVSTMAVGDPSRIANDVLRLLGFRGRFASTVPRNAIVAPALGDDLHLEERFDGKFGCYAIYRRGV